MIVDSQIAPLQTPPSLAPAVQAMTAPSLVAVNVPLQTPPFFTSAVQENAGATNGAENAFVTPQIEEEAQHAPQPAPPPQDTVSLNAALVYPSDDMRGDTSTESEADAPQTPASGQLFSHSPGAFMQSPQNRNYLVGWMQDAARDPQQSAQTLQSFAQAADTPQGAAWLAEMSKSQKVSSAFSQMEGEALQDPRGRTSEEALLNAAAAHPDVASNLQGVRAQAAATDTGRAALTDYFQSIARNTALARSQVIADTEASKQPAGLATLTQRNQAMAGDSAIAAAYVQMAQSASSTAEGRTALAAYHDRAAADSRLAASNVHLEASAATTPQGAKALHGLYQSVASDNRLSLAHMRGETAALGKHSGREALASLYRQEATSPALAASHEASTARVVQMAHEGSATAREALTNHMTAVSQPDIAGASVLKDRALLQTEQGKRMMEQRQAFLSHDASLSAVDAIRKTNAAATPRGVAALIDYNNATATSTRLAASEALVLSQAASTDQGAQAVHDYLRAHENKPDLATSFWKAMATASQSPEGRQASAALLRSVAANPPLATAQQHSLAAAASTTDGAAAIKEFMQQAQWEPALGDALRGTQAAALDTPQGSNATARLMHSVSLSPRLAAATLPVLGGDSQLLSRIAADVEASRGFVTLMQSATATPIGRDVVREVRMRPGVDGVLQTVAAAAASVLPDKTFQASRAASSDLRTLVDQARTPEGAAKLQAAWTAAARNPDVAHETLRRFDQTMDNPQGRPSYVDLLQAVSHDTALSSSLLALQQSARRSPGGEATIQHHIATIWSKPDTAQAYQAVLQRVDHPTAPLGDPSSNSRTLNETVLSSPTVNLVHNDVPAPAHSHTVIDTDVSVAPPAMVAEHLQLALGTALGSPLQVAPPATVTEHLQLVDTGVGEATETASPASITGLQMQQLVCGDLTPASLDDNPNDTRRAGQHLDVRSDERGVVDDKGIGAINRLDTDQRTRTVAPVEPVALFDLSGAQRRVCRRCGDAFESRAPACPNCQAASHQTMITSMNAIQKNGYVIQKEIDAVEMTVSAQQALEAPDRFVFLRRAPTCVQYRDVLAINSASSTGYAVIPAA